ncbi:MAG: RNA polymerase sigma factor [Gammaproteobacteria bacterium]|nr:RNA polymerase sigma factor [Gammaproteobacteria bacterium]
MLRHLDLATTRRILKGDQAAFRALFDEYFPRLYRFALVRLHGDAAEAEDIVQQTFCRAIERLDSYRGEAALYTWFCQIASNLIIDHYRRQQREHRRVVLIEDNPEIQAILTALTDPGGERGEAELVRRDVARLVQATMDHLPGHYGDVLEWKYVDDLPVAEIAARLRLSVKAAESLLGRARTAFRDALSAVGSIDGISGAMPSSRQES